MPAPPTRNLTILLTDIKGFTDKTSHKTRSAIQELLDKHREIVLPILEGRQGRLIKTIGDAFLMVFESPTDAVLAGVAVQEALKAHNAGKAEPDRIEVRIAINLGEVNLSDNDIFGEPVNITARIEAVTEAGEVYFTEAVYLAMNKSEVPSSEVGLLQLKGIPEKIRVYKVRREVPVEGAARAVPQARRHLWDLLRGRGLPSPVAGSVPPPAPLGRRAGALAIDFLLVSILASMLVGEKAESVPALERDWGAKGKIKITLPKAAGVSIPAIEAEGFKAGSGGIEVDPNAAGAWRSTSATVKTLPALPIFWVIYAVAFVGWRGATPGKRLLGLVVLRADGSAADWRDASARALFSLVSAFPAGLGYAWAWLRKDRMTWHDLLSQTRVASSRP